MRLCSCAVMQLCSCAVMQLCSCTVVQLCSCAACPPLAGWAVVQFCSYAVVQLCSLPAMPMAGKLVDYLVVFVSCSRNLAGFTTGYISCSPVLPVYINLLIVNIIL